MRQPLVQLLPPPRHRPGTADLAAAATAALAPAVLIAALIATDLMRCGRPAVFTGLVLLPWLAWLHLAGWSGLHGRRALLVLALRAALLTALVTALAEPRAVRQGDRLGVVFCLDQSDSIGAEAGEQARTWMLRAVAGMPTGDRAGLVLFARDAAVELPVRERFQLAAWTSRIARGSTDLERALDLAADALPEDGPGRIVLASDGVATAGAAERAIERLAARGIPVDVLPLTYAHPAEVWLDRLELAEEALPGDTCEAAAVLVATAAGRGELVLRLDDRVLGRSVIAWEAGRRRLRLPVTVREPGLHRLTAAIDPEPGCDGWRENNLAYASLRVEGDDEMLLCIDPQGHREDWQPLAAALAASGRRLRVEPASACPDDPLAFAAATSVWLVNVPADAFTQAQQTALRDAVRDLGVGLVMVGGGNGFGPGGWSRSPVEEALPVRMDPPARRALPAGALAVVLHSHDPAADNTWIRRIVRQTLRSVPPEDTVGVIDAGGDGERWTVSLTPAVEYERLAPHPERTPSGRPAGFATLLAQAADALAASSAASRHLIIVSDGDPAPPPPELIRHLIAHRIAVSAVSLLPQGSEEAPAFTALAEATGGRAYLRRDPDHLPRILASEARTLRRSQVQNRSFTPQVSSPSPVLKDIDVLPPLHGYVLTDRKATAQVVLSTEASAEGDPVLAFWRFGIGAAAAVSTDLGSNWARDWLAWDRYRAFADQLASAVARGTAHGRLHLRIVADGAEGVALLADRDPRGGLDLPVASLEGPDGHASLILQQVAPDRWQARFPTPLAGRYRVTAATGGSERRERAVAGLDVAYPAEYRRFRSDPAMLARIASRTGGRLLRGDEAEAATLFRQARSPRSVTRSVLDWVFLAAALLIPLDVAARRLHLDQRSLALAWRWRGTGTRAPQALPPAVRQPSPTTAAPPPPSGNVAAHLLDARRRRADSRRQDPP